MPKWHSHSVTALGIDAMKEGIKGDEEEDNGTNKMRGEMHKDGRHKGSPDNAMNDGIDENAHVEEQVELAGNVEARESDAVLVADILVENTHNQHGQSREEQIVH